MNTQIIAIANQKGGVGKTTTCANLGIGLAQEGKKVLLIDGDPQGSLSISLGYSRPDTLPVTLSDMMGKVLTDTPIQPGEGILHHAEGVDLMPADIQLSGMEVSLVNAMSRETILRQYLDTVKRDYTHILIDCQPSLGMLTVNALAAANRVLIPVQAEYLPAKGLEQLLQTISKVRRQINPKLQIDGILLTMVDGRTNFAKEISALLRETYGSKIKVFGSEIPHSVRAKEISAEGKNDQTSSEFAPFLNIMNEWYLRDCSRKIRSTLKAKGNDGKHISSVAIYGYKKDPEDSSHWLIDEEAAEVVRRIFRLTIEGYSTHQIANMLAEEKVERPSYYLEKRGHGTYRNRCDMSDPYNWRDCTIRSILMKPEYIGKTVNFRTYSKSYKDKTRRRNDKDNWSITEDTQEPIIDEHTWNLVQQLTKTRRRIDNLGEANPLTGLLFCADCGAKMHSHRSVSHSVLDKEGNDTGRMSPSYDYYQCAGNDNSRVRRKDSCSTHFVRSEAIREIVLEVIRYASASAIPSRQRESKCFPRAGGLSRRCSVPP